jgi:hypothetical protein
MSRTGVYRSILMQLQQCRVERAGTHVSSTTEHNEKLLTATCGLVVNSVSSSWGDKSLSLDKTVPSGQQAIRPEPL